MEEKSVYKKLKRIHSLNNLLFNKFRFPGSRKLGRFITKQYLPALETTVKCPTVFGFDLNVNKNGGNELYKLGFYEIGTLNIFKKILDENSVFIDVGASLGLMTVFAAKNCGVKKILSFEPEKERFNILKSNIELNNLQNVTIFPVGIGMKEETVKLYTGSFSPSIVDSEGKDDLYEIIQIKKLDDILTSSQIQKVDFIKVDIEGYEIDALSGCSHLLSSDNPPALCVEYVRKLQKQSNDLYDFIKQINKYRIFQLTRTNNTISPLTEIKSSEQLVDFNNMFCFHENHFQKLNSIKNLFI